MENKEYRIIGSVSGLDGGQLDKLIEFGSWLIECMGGEGGLGYERDLDGEAEWVEVNLRSEVGSIGSVKIHYKEPWWEREGGLDAGVKALLYLLGGSEVPAEVTIPAWVMGPGEAETTYQTGDLIGMLRYMLDREEG